MLNVDIQSTQIQIAKTLGADSTFLVNVSKQNENEASKSLAKEIVSLFKSSCYADATIECSGAASRYANSCLYLYLVLVQI